MLVASSGATKEVPDYGVLGLLTYLLWAGQVGRSATTRRPSLYSGSVSGQEIFEALMCPPSQDKRINVFIPSL